MKTRGIQEWIPIRIRFRSSCNEIIASNEPGHSWQVEPKALEEVSGTDEENPSGGGKVGDGTSRRVVETPQLVVEK